MGDSTYNVEVENMKRLSIYKTEVYKDIEQLSLYLDKCERNSINSVNWSEFPYCPEVSFAMGYNSNGFLLKYWVREDCFIAAKTDTNDNVYQDSCVEFFVAFDDKGYYNLEWNGIGTTLMGYGKDRYDRVRLDSAVVNRIDCKSSLPHIAVSEEIGYTEWSLTLFLPLEVFIYHIPALILRESFKANFYKCGDSLSQRHYLSWSPIATHRPDFHQPSFFSKIEYMNGINI